MFEEVSFSEIALNVAMKFARSVISNKCFANQIKKVKNINFYDLYCTIILNLSNEGEN